MTLLRALAATTILLTGALAEERPARTREVTVCMNPGANGPAVFRAQAAASAMLAKGEIRLSWRSDPRSCSPMHGPVVRLSENTPANDHPGAMAHALPYEGQTIVVFFDRVQAAKVPSLLAHVLTHELTHVLQGVAVHSNSEMMKPRWEPGDYVRMRQRALQFAEEDLLLIHHGLNARDGVK